MDRLTTYNTMGAPVLEHADSCARCDEPIWNLNDFGYGNPIAKLAAYEDTGLTPEEIIDGKMLTGWIPVSERLPADEKDNEYFFCTCYAPHRGYFVKTCQWCYGEFSGSGYRGTVVAWSPTPEPWKGE